MASLTGKHPVISGPSVWRGGVVLVATFLAMPVIVILGFLLVPAGEVWQHLVSTVLRDYVLNSLLLMLGVSIGVLILGVGSAWLTSMCRFPGSRLFEWSLLLPMAMPAYIIAYTYTGLFDFAGPVQSLLREWTGWGYGDYWFPEIRSLEGAALMLSLVLFPYVYLLSRAAFLGQSLCVLDVSRTLGNGPWRTFFTVALPLARPAIVAGLSLALMETLADYGTVQYFGVATFTTGIFRTWFGLDSTAAAAQLSAVLLLFVFVLVLLERGSRRSARYHHTSQRHQALRRYPLTGWRGSGAALFCFGILFFGFLLPAGQLLIWAATTSTRSNASDRPRGAVGRPVSVPGMAQSGTGRHRRPARPGACPVPGLRQTTPRKLGRSVRRTDCRHGLCGSRHRDCRRGHDPVCRL